MVTEWGYEDIFKHEIILASSSPRRIEILRENGIDPIIIHPQIDETVPDGAEPHIAVMFLALKKALYAECMAVERGCTRGAMILAADTAVIFEDRIIGKPADRANAFRILKKLCGETHNVMTGVAMLASGTALRRVFYDSSMVTFKDYCDSDIEEYIETLEPYDKAGGYAAQGAWEKNIASIEGSRSNVIGLPWELVLRHSNSFSALGGFCVLG